MQGHEFRSEELFWDQKQAKVYSDKYIEIKRGALELKGYGFESNQQMTDYRILRPPMGNCHSKRRRSIDSLVLQPDSVP